MRMTRRTVLAGSAALMLGSPSKAAGALEMPPEAGPHTRTFMQWPVSEAVYGRALLGRVQASVATVARAIAEFEPVVVLAGPEHVDRAIAKLGGGPEVWPIPTNDLWCRDSGPTFVRDAQGQLAVSQIQFNGWGAKQRHDHDARVAARVAERLGVPYVTSGLVGEQGGLEHDGAGLVLGHASSWINRNRNAGNRAEVETMILAAVGGRKMIWAPGIKGADITDYHIDALARFVAPGKVLIQLPAVVDRDDPWSVAAMETLDILKSATTLEGKPLDIVVMPEPVAIRSRDKDFVAAYVNYYVCNGGLVLSEFGDKEADGRAREILEGLYPGRRIVTLNTDPIGSSGGGIHCATQQQPVV